MEIGRVSFAGLSLLVPADWVDISDEVSPGDTPTLAKAHDDAIGALQFSLATYNSGAPPRFTVHTIQTLLFDFFLAREFGVPKFLKSSTGEICAVSGDYCACEKYIRVWYVSDGSNLALVTYTSLIANDRGVENELLEAEKIVLSIRF